MPRMTIPIKTGAEIDGMRLAGRLASEVLDMLTPHVKAGVTTREIDRIAHEYMVEVQGGVRATVGSQAPGYAVYPASVCAALTTSSAPASRRPAAEERRRAEHRRHRHQGRLAR